MISVLRKSPWQWYCLLYNNFGYKHSAWYVMQNIGVYFQIPMSLFMELLEFSRNFWFSVPFPAEASEYCENNGQTCTSHFPSLNVRSWYRCCGILLSVLWYDFAGSIDNGVWVLILQGFTAYTVMWLRRQYWDWGDVDTMGFYCLHHDKALRAVK